MVQLMSSVYGPLNIDALLIKSSEVIEIFFRMFHNQPIYYIVFFIFLLSYIPCIIHRVYSWCARLGTLTCIEINHWNFLSQWWTLWVGVPITICSLSHGDSRNRNHTRTWIRYTLSVLRSYGYCGQRDDTCVTCGNSKSYANHDQWKGNSLI